RGRIDDDAAGAFRACWPEARAEPHAVRADDLAGLAVLDRRKMGSLVHAGRIGGGARCVYSLVGIHWAMGERSATTRERIIKAAVKLFHGEGIRAVSVDAVAAKAGVTKRTLYYHFRSKDDLIAAYLETRDQPNLVVFRQWFDEAAGDIADKVEAIFE